MIKLRREIDILKSLRDSPVYLPCATPDRPDHYDTLQPHPNLVTLYQTYETPVSTILLLEYLPGINLHDFVFESIRLTESMARGMFRQLVSATSFCHSRGIVYVSPLTLRFNERQNAQLFGYSLRFASDVGIAI
jgi:serine/threonine protein kinase